MRHAERPNVLLILVDEQRYPVVYENEELRRFRQQYLPAQERIRQHAVEFHRHYTASTACAPSRTSLFTGHYPSLHGVSQTDGMAKRADDPGMFWLPPDTVPTMGDYFRAAGYKTYYKGKWHLSHAGLIDERTGKSLPSSETSGVLIRENVERYLNADMLDGYGFTGWVGPEPHGADQVNAGINRDLGFATQAVELIDQLEAERSLHAGESSPWFTVVSFVNPHDIVMFGLLWRRFGYAFTDDTVPDIPAAPTRHESFEDKPSCHKSYRGTYTKMFGPQPTFEIYRKLYYYLHKLVDLEISRVYDRLRRSSFYENTWVVFTSDHGDMLGAHGGMHQKWHNAYEETIHVPLLISNPSLQRAPRAVQRITSHIDLLPTLVGLCGGDVNEAMVQLRKDHRVVYAPVGRDLSGWVLGETPAAQVEEAVYFMTDDEISSGESSENVLGFEYAPVTQPNHVEAVVASLSSRDGAGLWKFSRYFDPDGVKPDEFELYDLVGDALEERNLAHPNHLTPRSREARERLERILQDQRRTKRLVPE